MFAITLSLKKNNINKLSNLFKKSPNENIFVSINFLSLGGLPPFTGFLPKFLVISKIAIRQLSHLLIPIILGSLIRLFFYLRVSFNSFFFLKTLPNIIKPIKNIKTNYLPVIINIIGFMLSSIIILLLLDFKLNKL